MALFTVNLGAHALHAREELEDESFHLPARSSRPRILEPLPEESLGPPVQLNISGTRFHVSRDLLHRAPEHSVLRNLKNDEVWIFDDDANEYITDRSAGVFHAILVYLRTFQLHIPTGMCRTAFREEIEFWGFSEKVLSVCCRPRLTNKEKRRLEEERKRSELVKSRWKDACHRVINQIRMRSSQASLGTNCRMSAAIQMARLQRSPWQLLKHRVWGITDLGGWEQSHPYFKESQIASKIFVFISISFVLLAVTSFCLETLPDYRLQTTITCPDNSTVTDGSDCVYDTQDISTPAFRTIEVICVVYFTAEVVIRGLACPAFVPFLLSFLTFIDLAAILPFYILLIIGGGGSSAAGVRILRLFRIFRALKFGRHSSGLQILGVTINSSYRELGVIGLFLGINMVVFASIMYFAEKDVTDTFFNSIPTAMWWAIVTMTTVGYGDLFPISNLGKLVGAICAISGVLTLALPMPVFVNKFTKLYEEDKAKKAEAKEAKRKRKAAESAITNPLSK